MDYKAVLSQKLKDVFDNGQTTGKRFISKDRSVMAVVSDETLHKRMEAYIYSRKVITSQNVTVGSHLKFTSRTILDVKKICAIVSILDDAGFTDMTLELTDNSDFPIRISTSKIQFYVAPKVIKKVVKGV
jgi:hypothetical protein